MGVYRELGVWIYRGSSSGRGPCPPWWLFIVAGSTLFSYALTLMEVPALITAKLLALGL